jgi:hypothetical protein
MKRSILVCAAIAAMCTSASASELKIYTMWANSGPDVPSELQAGCLGKALQESRTCQVIRYQGYTTWAYSFKDSRMSLALVSFDADGKVVRNVEHKGPGHLVSMSPDTKGQTVTISGEDNRAITVPWSELGK